MSIGASRRSQCCSLGSSRPKPAYLRNHDLGSHPRGSAATKEPEPWRNILYASRSNARNGDALVRPRTPTLPAQWFLSLVDLHQGGESAVPVTARMASLFSRAATFHVVAPWAPPIRRTSICPTWVFTPAPPSNFHNTHRGQAFSPRPLGV
ncbi:hypothetical protein CCHR01_10976 [Colletotrichum chrysophilum]|uniref:Uncharacterized protein n=1 Tax=Colletotrichum chrysophilum TaxID=1836956 RepID=A0AAD9AE13_9PEZI|nr:hypothetical protein CCHR01_10976 [Colletotrichum chrysophilum]